MARKDFVCSGLIFRSDMSFSVVVSRHEVLFQTACVSFELCDCVCMFEAFRALQCMAFDAIFGIHSMSGFPEPIFCACSCIVACQLLFLAQSCAKLLSYSP